jgi:hypothetical protein
MQSAHARRLGIDGTHSLFQHYIMEARENEANENGKAVFPNKIVTVLSLTPQRLLCWIQITSEMRAASLHVCIGMCYVQYEYLPFQLSMFITGHPMASTG